MESLILREEHGFSCQREQFSLSCRSSGVEDLGEAGKDLADVGHADFTADRRDAIGFEGCPEPVAGEIAEGKVRVVLVVVLADEIESGGEPVADGLAPRDVIGRSEPLVDEIKGRHEQ